jgi:hypothetical protein
MGCSINCSYQVMSEQLLLFDLLDYNLRKAVVWTFSDILKYHKFKDSMCAFVCMYVAYTVTLCRDVVVREHVRVVQYQ